MSYKVGDMVVYPRHGAAKVEAITERTVKGVTREYLQLSVLSSDGLVINVPVDNAKKVGVRDIVSASEAAKVFGILWTPIIATSPLPKLLGHWASAAPRSSRRGCTGLAVTS